MPATEGAPVHGSPSDLLPPSWTSIIPLWLSEDTPSFDYGGFVVGSSPAEARLLAKSPGVLAGVPFFDAIFSHLGCNVEWHVQEGQDVGGSRGEKQHVATVRGPVRNLLLGERVALNVLARCSGVASQSRKLLGLLRGKGYRNVLAGTRKTTPGFRLVEKYGMLVAGVDTHRVDLSTMTMLKDNHVWACGGSIGKAVAAAKSAGGFSIKVEVECRSLAEAEEAVDAGADVVMLDNFEPEDMKTAARKLKEKYGRGPRAPLIEVSGGLTEENVERYVCDDVDVISSSSIHQGVKHVDFSLKVVPKEETDKKGGESLAQ
ncbi:nicotinate-nucleotide pyrophosphorylase [Myriangium duriaei CBS 260.36]|uniref:Nicotinate-nucleotide pyrophosphorylase [carboxylating] n=1 Tax=Myriangium duriaei CBS 260.36 TaxID=1168546 RepID=A0A9P4J4E3_9PEZI|nr:nicotinate-nucleotide pyrophosphorylase [Myriangium duriaei CBS 260.36]